MNMFAPRYSRIWEFEAFGSTASCPSSGIFGSADFRWLLVAYGGTTSCSCYSWVITLLSNMIPQKSLNFDSSVGEFNQTLQSKDFFLQVNQWTLETWAHSSPHRQYVNDKVLQFNTSPSTLCLASSEISLHVYSEWTYFGDSMVSTSKKGGQSKISSGHSWVKIARSFKDHVNHGNRCMEVDFWLSNIFKYTQKKHQSLWRGTNRTFEATKKRYHWFFVAIFLWPEKS